MAVLRPSARRGGFTLIELMIVVVIVSILAAVALPMFRTYQLRSRTAEGVSNLGAIRVAEEAFFSEAAAYVTAGPEPPAVPGVGPVPFDSAGTAFAQLGFVPEGNVYFSYGVQASADQTGYTADAGADIDGNGIVQFWGYVKPNRAGATVPGPVGCNVAALTPLDIGPCSPGAGRSIF